MPPPAQSPPQEKLLDEAQQVVRVEAFEMKRCLDNNKLMDALKHASTMLSELRTSLLSPKAYYELYMAITNELSHLEMFLVDEFEKGNQVSDLYELVQYAGNIVPRLYLLVTVGSVYIKSKQVPVKDIMKDLVEMCRGVQHPLRGLFLRNYLLSCVKRDLPEAKDEESGSLSDSIDFILLNFAEMNKLWVRMQHQGHTRQKAKREQERRELRLLVGTNLVRLSNLDGVDINTYSKIILPPVLEQVVKCKDAIAQEYLMECIIQVFPDDFHLDTLDAFLKACGHLRPSVDVKAIITALIDRLAAYATREEGGIPPSIPLFEIFSEQVKGVIAARETMEVAAVVSLQVSLANLALKVYADRTEYIDQVLEFTTDFLNTRNVENIDSSNPVNKPLTRLVKIPVEEYTNIVAALQLEHFVGLMQFFGYTIRKELALYTLQSTLEKGSLLEDADQVETFLELVSPLIQDQDDEPADEEALDDEEMEEEQVLVGRLVHQFVAQTPDMQFQIISAARKRFGAGGERRIKYTLPPLLFSTFRLAREYKAAEGTDDLWEKKLNAIYKFCSQTIEAISELPELKEFALRLYLQAALAVNNTEYEKAELIAYDFMSKAYLIYEEDISDTSARMTAILVMVATLEQMSCFSEENYKPLATNCAQASKCLLKKPDQCRGVVACANLFWTGQTTDSEGEKRDSKQVLQCLTRGLKIANNCMEAEVKVQLFVEIFQRYLHFYEQGCDTVTIGHINKIAGIIEENMPSVEDPEIKAQVSSQYSNALTHIEARKGSKDSPSYAEFSAES